MDLYDNGEIVTKERMEDEPWYDDYQSLIEITCSLSTDDVGKLLEAANKDYEEVFGKPYPNPEQMLRWCVLQAARTDSFNFYEAKKYVDK